MAFRLGTLARNAGANGAINLVDAGGGAGKILIRTSTQPTNVGDADSGTLLATLPLSATAFGAASTGVKTANSITSDTNAAASGSATQFRMKDFANAVIADGTCGLGSGDLSFDNNVIVAGGTVAITSFLITQPIS